MNLLLVLRPLSIVIGRLPRGCLALRLQPAVNAGVRVRPSASYTIRRCRPLLYILL